MHEALRDTGIDAQAFQRFLEEQIYTLPGTASPRDVFSVLLTGSRAMGTFTPASDIDVDVVCPQTLHEAVLQASYEAGIITSKRSFFWPLRGDDWGRYFGEEKGRPHFSVTSLEVVAQQLRDCEDVAIWIWTKAKIIADPHDQFGLITRGFRGYPADVLSRKIKYHWLMAGYAEVDIFPHRRKDANDVLPAATALLTAVNELLRLCFLVEGKPFPYTEKLMVFARHTALGKQICPYLQRVIDLVVGSESVDVAPEERMDLAAEGLFFCDKSEEKRQLSSACENAMIAAGVDPQWVEADYGNIDELLSGQLGPIP